MKYAHYFLICLWAMACQATPPQYFDKITYRYRDSSVEARFHRSYTVVLAASGKAKVSVDVYGDTIAHKKFNINQAEFNRLKALSKMLPSGGKKLSGAKGGSSQTIHLSKTHKQVYRLIWDNRTKETSETTALIQYVKQLTPDLEKLLATKHDVHSSELAGNAQDYEQTKALEIRTALKQVKNTKKEKELLKSLWMLTRKNTIGNYPLHVSLGIGIQDKNGQAVHINQRQQGHTAHITLRGLDRNNNRKQKWEVKIVHQPIDMNNLAELMYE
ncbi:hypothetical protein [Microscilla marina]|uniref:Lipoprotein, putative n=1 Tax=Microscilla marina ATCC 23134 TaxID=313606 RepID=A1ZJ21_MICM2|nr:hypothetical protein [Microscilla marina]EAY29557.1 lipoprotein, putative [Microscilla marina ATCC 23134]